jgi:hypothetical protein
MTEK